MLRNLAERIYHHLVSRPFRYGLFFSRLQRVFFTRTTPEYMAETLLQFADAHRMEGDYLEFGCFRGDSMIRAMRLSRLLDHLARMRFYAFDSFHGLPRIQGNDDNGNCVFRQGDFFCSRADFDRAIRASGVDQSKLTVVEGWFHDTLTPERRATLPIRKAAIVWVDCDLYESTVPVLDFITPYIQDGTIIHLDDWFAFRGRPDQGQPKAFAEWLAKNPRFSATFYRQSDWASRAFIINVDADPAADDLLRRTIR